MRRGLWARLLTPCWFRHARDKHFDVDARGRHVWTCSRCLRVVRVREPDAVHPRRRFEKGLTMATAVEPFVFGIAPDLARCQSSRCLDLNAGLWARCSYQPTVIAYDRTVDPPYAWSLCDEHAAMLQRTKTDRVLDLEPLLPFPAMES